MQQLANTAEHNFSYLSNVREGMRDLVNNNVPYVHSNKKMIHEFQFFHSFDCGITEILFILSDIKTNNACIEFKGDGNHAYFRKCKYGYSCNKQSTCGK